MKLPRRSTDYRPLAEIVPRRSGEALSFELPGRQVRLDGDAGRNERVVTGVPRLPEAHERPRLPDGPYLVAGLGRAGRAALSALNAMDVAGPLRACDEWPSPRVRAAQAELEAAGIRMGLGERALSLLDEEPAVRCLLKSPGIPFDSPVISQALARSVPVLDELELGWRLDRRPMVGITGTNGKSTTAALAVAVLGATGARPALAGNTRFGPPLSVLPAEAGEVVVCEVSSYQLEGCPELLPEVAVFTNLTEEHLDRHGTVDHAGRLKRRLFVRGERCVPRAVVNVDDPAGERLAAELDARGADVARYGFRSTTGHRVRQTRWTLDRGVISLETPSGDLELETRLPGRHNALNVAAAVALGDLLGIELGRVAAAIEAFRGLPGRLERIQCDAGFDVLVDFGHNPAGVRHALETVRAVVERRAGARLICVLGPPTIETAAQRRAMALAAAELSDHLFLTTQRWFRSDPRDAPSPGVVEGAHEAAAAPWEVVLERTEAIERALASARRGDVVLIFGRSGGTGTAFDLADRLRPLDDRADALAALERLR